MAGLISSPDCHWTGDHQGKPHVHIPRRASSCTSMKYAWRRQGWAECSASGTRWWGRVGGYEGKKEFVYLKWALE